jgi:thioredoxin reductase (NADPH)
VATVNELDDWPATGEVSGVELAASIVERISVEGAGVYYENVTGMEKNGELWQVKGDKSTLRGKRVIAAAGARRGVGGGPGEETRRGLGVSQCAHGDGGFFKGQDVAVIGSGDAALQEAIVLTEMCRTVYIVVRGELHARRSYVDKAYGKTNVKFIWDTEVSEIAGDNGVTGLKLRNRKDGKASELAVSGVFPFVGVEPNNAFLPAAIERDKTGRVLTDARLRSNDPTLFVVGALRSGYAGDLVSAAGEAAAAVQQVAAEVGMPAM